MTEVVKYQKLSRAETLQLIQLRLESGVYITGDLGYKWSQGQWRGYDIQDLPTEYLHWHVCMNDNLSRFHLEWLFNHFSVCDWSWPEWHPPAATTLDEPGHYSDSKGQNHGHYTGLQARSQPVSEDLYWFRMRASQGAMPKGREIKT